MPDEGDNGAAPERRDPAASLLARAAHASLHLAETGTRLYLDQLRGTERAFLRLLSQRMEAVDESSAEAPDEGHANEQRSPGDQMEALLERSLEQSADDGRDELLRRVMNELLPDEARILAALSDGPGAAVAHIEARGRGRDRRILSNVSVIGSTAGLALPDMTSAYIERLLHLGLVELGPESQDPELAPEYELLLAERSVREAMKQTGPGPLGARAVRHTLQLSHLGAELWRACHDASPPNER